MRADCTHVTYELPEDFELPEDMYKEDSEHDDLRIYKKPEPEDFEKLEYTAEYVNDRFSFLEGGEKKLQVIVKLANIHLTPEKPCYDGGSWHIEGQLNEPIVASALYYYDNDSITDSHLSFRTKVDSSDFEETVDHEQGDGTGIDLIFGMTWGPSVQGKF
jgi:hypothetical protein